MNDRYRAAIERLTAHHQEHVLRFWDRLNEESRDALLRQIEELDFAGIARMREVMQSPSSTVDASTAEPAPVEVLGPAERIAARAAGETALRAGEVGVVLVAGGQGSRLGFDGPKGAFKIGPVSGASLFEIHAHKIVALERKFGTAIPFYVMTSESNDVETRACFRTHDAFGLQPERVCFFKQGMWPALSEAGTIILDRPDHIFMSPDGHGGTLSALRGSGALDDMRNRKLRMLFYFQVDNPLVDVADPVFLGFHAAKGADISVKVCAKRDPEEKLGVVVSQGERFAMVEYTELTTEQKHARLPDGSLRFQYGSVAIHCFSLDFLQEQAEVELPLHLAHKKVPTCDDGGNIVTPAEPNAYKFEKFIFDVIPNAGRAVNLAFDRADEFSPVKNTTGEDSPATVVRDLTAKFARWLESAGVDIPRDGNGQPLAAIEIDPLVAVCPADLIGKLPPGLDCSKPVLLR